MDDPIRVLCSFVFLALLVLEKPFRLCVNKQAVDSDIESIMTSMGKRLRDSPHDGDCQ